MANTESVAALLKDPRKKMKRKVAKTTGIANAIQRRIANGSYGQGKGRTGGNFKAGPTVGSTQRPLVKSTLAQLGSQGNQSAKYASKVAGTKPAINTTSDSAVKRALLKKKMKGNS